MRGSNTACLGSHVGTIPPEPASAHASIYKTGTP